MHPFDPARLKEIIRRLEDLDRRIEQLQGDKSAVYRDAEALSFTVAALKRLLRERRRRQKSLRVRYAEAEMLELYRAHAGPMDEDAT